jgi:hypothetical protein
VATGANGAVITQTRAGGHGEYAFTVMGPDELGPRNDILLSFRANGFAPVRVSIKTAETDGQATRTPCGMGGRCWEVDVWLNRIQGE